MEKLSLHCDEYGEGTPVLLLHGLFGAGFHWNEVAGSLSQHHKVIIPDLRNHGHSPNGADIDYRLMAADIEALLKERGVSKVVAAGHSMGGKLALHLAANTHLIEKLIITDIAPRAYPPRYSDILSELWKLALRKRNRKTPDLSSPDTQTLHNEIYSRVVEIFLEKNFPGKAAEIRWMLNLPVLVRWYRNVLKRIDLPMGFPTPVLFIRSATSGYVTEHDREHIQRTFRNARVHTVYNAGHWLHVEAPGILARQIISFCAE